MATIITGLFKSQSESHAIAKDLENAGFSNSEYITYVHDRHIPKEVKTSIWQYFFKDKTTLEDDSLVVSVKIKTPEQMEIVKKVFSNNDCIHENYFQNIKFREARSLEYLKKIVSLRAKAEIYKPLDNNHRGQSEGINAEVVFGKKE